MTSDEYWDPHDLTLAQVSTFNHEGDDDGDNILANQVSSVYSHKAFVAAMSSKKVNVRTDPKSISSHSWFRSSFRSDRIEDKTLRSYG